VVKLLEKLKNCYEGVDESVHSCAVGVDAAAMTFVVRFATQFFCSF
jgi:hypothetical protein